MFFIDIFIKKKALPFIVGKAYEYQSVVQIYLGIFFEQTRCIMATKTKCITQSGVYCSFLSFI
jgi:hypothetical protein